MAKLALAAMAIGFLPQTAGFVVRWILAEHVPLSNMYEYMGLMSWMTTLSLFTILARYKKPVFGSFISPVVFMLMVTASLLPKEISQALLPALQSYWITIHVTLAALGSGAFAVACAVSFVYLLAKSSKSHSGAFNFTDFTGSGAVSILFFPPLFAFGGKIIGFLPAKSELTIVVGESVITGWGSFFSGLGLALPLSALLWTYLFRKKAGSSREQGSGVGIFTLVVITLLLSGIFTGILAKTGIIAFSPRSAWKVFEFFGAMWLCGIPLFIPVYWIIARKGYPYFRRANINLDLLDEINYRMVSLGYPLYTVGALFAGAIWAEQAWGSFWSWDPKEVGALIIWLFYSGFLHARRQPKWRGSRAAILAVFGFLMILLSFFGNYFFGGQHTFN